MLTGHLNHDQRMSSAITHYRAGKPLLAKDICESILAEDLNHADARHLVGIVSLELGKLDEGIGHLRALILQSPDYPGAQALLAKAFMAAGRSGEAIEALRAALETSPEDISLLNNLGSLLAGNEDFPAAVCCFEQAVKLNEGLPISHYNLAKALRDTGDRDRAIEHYSRTVALDPGFATAWKNLGNLYIDIGEVALAAKAYVRGARIKWSPKAKKTPDASHKITSRSKLQHDIEQLEYLLLHGRVDEKFQQVLDGYRNVLENMPDSGEESRLLPLSAANRKRLPPYFNRLIYRPESPALNGSAVNPELDVSGIKADYFKNAPGMTFVDDFLTQEALQELRRFCLESTLWYSHRYAKGYVGAFMEEGFVSPLLLQIADELSQAFPEVFGSATLRKLWAFKYDSRLSGIPMHADFAAVNVNFWITQNAANKDPESGGLVVWDKQAPLDWDFATYNADEEAMRRFLSESDAKPYRIPYRENRMVMFNSDLFHATDELSFEKGYENRRINITMLYGTRKTQCS